MFMKYKDLLEKMKEFDYYITRKDIYDNRLYNMIHSVERNLRIEHKNLYDKLEEIEKQSITLQCQKCIIKALEQRIAKLEAQIEKCNTTKNKKS